VKQVELQMLYSALKMRQTAITPKVTLIVVNKRVNQRFFDTTSLPANPPEGTLIDTELV